MVIAELEQLQARGLERIWEKCGFPIALSAIDPCGQGD